MKKQEKTIKRPTSKRQVLLFFYFFHFRNITVFIAADAKKIRAMITPIIEYPSLKA